ncbi:transporter substrate-binding domain-containing protein [Endozoicomonas sp. SM1973]|uniref:Transporter substrate-binding domain-containing protein n=1 Tax=Spartinivicinus marinus TaxID=2994442 RepID=A0A853I7X0_9GAMM|nr:transporter substrate-binding domain-containing protein [Spartinivicinus marinus]MCX4026907.1 transporter substrate-binding domain-containing protein [Spartinivicinus marinus]NYZ66748.1 transporter substrate-binding domain-containing protein [Spartinivicinus marinus]
MYRVIWILAVIIASSSTGAELTLSIAQITGEDPLTVLSKKILRSAYKSIGVKVKFIKLPGERALALTNQGVIDGELFRKGGLANQYPNLIQVPYSYIGSSSVVFVKSKIFQVEGWESLRPYRIAVMVGYKVAEQNTKGFKVSFVDTPEQGFQMLAIDRVDIVIAPPVIGQSYVDRLGLKGIQMLLPPLQEAAMYHYLHKKHKTLLPKISAALQNMVENDSD